MIEIESGVDRINATLVSLDPMVAQMKKNLDDSRKLLSDSKALLLSAKELVAKNRGKKEIVEALNGLI